MERIQWLIQGHVGSQKTLAQNSHADRETDCCPTRPVAKGTLLLTEDDGVLIGQCPVPYFPEVLCSQDA